MSEAHGPREGEVGRDVSNLGKVARMEQVEIAGDEEFPGHQDAPMNGWEDRGVEVDDIMVEESTIEQGTEGGNAGVAHEARKEEHNRSSTADGEELEDEGEMVHGGYLGQSGGPDGRLYRGNMENGEQTLRAEDAEMSAEGSELAIELEEVEEEVIDGGQENQQVREADEVENEEEEEVVVRKRPRSRVPVIIPEYLKRRSTRTRIAVDRYSEPDDDYESSSEPEASSDSDYDVNDDESYEEPTRRRGLTSKRTRKRLARESSSDQRSSESESGSDSDWQTGSRKLNRTGRRASRKRKRRKLAESSEDEEKYQRQRFSDRNRGIVNYAEYGDSDEDILDEEDRAAARYEKEHPVEEDPSIPCIEAVIDYRPASGESDSEEPLADFQPNTVQYNIKWLRKSYRQNSWHTLDELKGIEGVKGIKRVTNYIKRISELAEYILQPETSPEEREECVMQREEIRAAVREYHKIERIVAERESAEDPDAVEYFVKWQDLPYSECTWEAAGNLTSTEDLAKIDAFHEREHGTVTPASGVKGKRLNPFSSRTSRKPFRRIVQQPTWLHGGPENRQLRDYQLAGLNWLAFSWVQNRNVILADEMGLGKTLQTIALLGYLMYNKNVPGPFLVIVPLSTIAAWVRECQRWLPSLNVVTYAGDAASRARIREYEFYPQKKKSGVNGTKFHVLLTTPELIMADVEYTLPIRWAMMVVDEAHRLKNENSSLHQILSSFTSANRLLITGTPLQNSVRELWALLSFLNPHVFSNAEEFETDFSFSALRDPDNVTKLHSTLRPYILRRQKTDVEKSLPKKSYAVLRVGMASSQQQYYKWIITKNFAALNSSAKSKGLGTSTKLLNVVMELKKCCNHPYLFQGFEDRNAAKPLISLIKTSGKMILLDKLLLRLREKGSRVLIFSQMVRMLDILQDYCRMRNFPHQRLDGSMRNDIRQRAVDHFNAEGSPDFVFLLSTRAGGLGINLATADTVIIFDSDWNPQNDLQAESRAHRIGQTKDVKVIRFLARDTVEEDILERAKRKRVLEHLVIHGVEQGAEQVDKDTKTVFKKEELSAILRFGAEKLFDDKDPVVGEAPSAEKAEASGTDGKDDEVEAEERRVLEIDDIDALLARGTENDGADDGLKVGASMGDSLLNAFKWADFVAEEDDEDLDGVDQIDEEGVRENAIGAAKKVTDLERRRQQAGEDARLALEKDRKMLEQEGDKEFWDRVIPDEIKQNAVATKLYVGPRQRKRTRTFADVGDMEDEDRKLRSKRARKGSGEKFNELNLKEIRSLIRSFKKFGLVARTEEILTDARLKDRCDKETGVKLLNELLENARLAMESSSAAQKSEPQKETSAANDQAASAKPGTVTVVFKGETVDVEGLLRRVGELKLLRRLIGKCDVDTAWRMKKLVKAPSYGVRWAMHHDSMLLIGINRHGFGHWELIAADSEIGLGSKLNINGRNPEGPDASKLARRASALLKALKRDEQSKREKARNKGSTSSKRTRKHAHKVSGDKQASGKSERKKKKPVNKKPSAAKISSPISKKLSKKSSKKMSRSLKAGKLLKHDTTILDELKDLSTAEKADTPESRKIRVQRTKRCLMKLGTSVEEIGAGNRKLQEDLWRYIHKRCRTNIDGRGLMNIYNKLALAQAARSQASKSQAAKSQAVKSQAVKSQAAKSQAEKPQETTQEPEN